MKKFLPLVLIAISLCAEARAVEVIGKTHTTGAVTSLSGPGADTRNLAAVYDMTIFEFSLGGKQTSINGSGITTNANYPLIDGEAVTNNTQIGLSESFGEKMKAGFLAEFYGLAGDRGVGRVFGQELPWDNFPREGGAIQPDRFAADLYHAFLEGQKENFKFKVVGGNLSPAELPEFARKDMNQVKLGSLVYRAPITNESYFEKAERKLEEGRHPLRGMDAIADVEYAKDRHWHTELFTGATEPTPIADIERDSYGGRTALDVGQANIGVTTVYSEGLRPTAGYSENEAIASVDASWKWTPDIIPYVTWAYTDYEREDTTESHAGEAVVAGAWFKLPNSWELKGQYQRAGENYDLLAGHKIEHYPSNFEGGQFFLTIPVNADWKIKATDYILRQIETATSAEDTLFGDPYFTSSTGSDRGTIGVQRLGAEFKSAGPLSASGYMEHAQFRKNTPLASNAIDKDVYNFYGGAAWSFDKQWAVEASWRHFFSVGNWQTMNFRSYQDIPEAALRYQFGPKNEHHVNLIYHWIDFEDNTGFAAGRNDYHGYQLFAECKIAL